jgi:hypothetical protein
VLEREWRTVRLHDVTAAGLGTPRRVVVAVSVRFGQDFSTGAVDRTGGSGRRQVGYLNYRAWLGTLCQRGFGFTRSVRIGRPEHIYAGAKLGIVGAGAPVYREDYG